MSTIETMICDCCGAKKDVTQGIRVASAGISAQLSQWVTVSGIAQDSASMIVQRYEKHYCGDCWQAASDTLKPRDPKTGQPYR